MAILSDIEKNVVVTVEPLSDDSASTGQRETFGYATEISAFEPPDGGLVAWSQVVAGFLLSAVSWGYPATFGVYQLYYVETLQLSPTQISWIGSTQTFLTYLICTISGRLSDAGYPLQLCLIGSFMVVSGTLLTSFAGQYWQIFLAQGVYTGLGLGIFSAAPTTVINCYFEKKKSLAMAASTMGTSAGSAVFPAVLQGLMPSIGFSWAVRCSALVAAVICINGCILLRPVPVTKKPTSLVDWSAFREPLYILFIVATCLIFWTLYFGFTYINSFAESQLSFTPTSAASLIIISTAVGIPIRPLSGFIADYYLGAFNTFILASILLAAAHFTWMAISTPTAMYAFAIFFGLVNGAWQGIWLGTMASLTKDGAQIGVRFGMVCTIAAFATLAGPPTASAIIEGTGGSFVGAQVWAGTVILLGGGAVAVGRWWQAGLKIWVKV